MNFNAQQEALFTWGAKGTGSCNLIARAGTGKTTTIIELANRIQGRAFLGAFNKAIAEELTLRIKKPNVTCGTMHSLGFQLWRGIAKGRSEVDSRKVRGIVRRLQLYPMDKNVADLLCGAVAYGKQSGLGLRGLDYTKEETWTPLLDHHDIWDELPATISPNRFVTDCITVYDESILMCQEEDPLIDFDDMILAPLMFSESKPSMYDWVMIDEAQDTNEVRRRLAMWVLRANGRMVAVGDPKQAIYGFAGANHDSMDLIKRDMQSIELPLSITYRCPKQIVALAQTLVPDIQAHESAPDGTITKMSSPEFFRQIFSTDDVILCRNTRPLVGVAKRLRKMGIPCVVEGANGKALIGLASKWGENITVGEMETRLTAYSQEQYDKWSAKHRMDKAEGAIERKEILMDIASEMSADDLVSDLVKHIEKMFGDRDNDDRQILRLCTVHRSKGREWKRVFLLGRELYMPSKWAEKEWELGQEDNLVYVAWTRVKGELVEVACKGKKNSEDPDWWEL